MKQHKEKVKKNRNKQTSVTADDSKGYVKFSCRPTSDISKGHSADSLHYLS